MAKRARKLTALGRDLDSLLKQAGISSLREYADECGVNYKYISQLRTIAGRRPGRIYVYLLKPFTDLKILDITESHHLSLRHRTKHLSFSECRELFPDLSEIEIWESIKQAGEVIEQVLSPPLEHEKRTPVFPEDDQILPGRELLYRNIFVGRQAELSALIDTFDAAAAGQGSLVMIAGEPGIGKTAICEQVSAYVSSREGLTLWGHCYEEGSLSLPYLAFVEAIRSYVLDREPDELKKVLGSAITDVARIVSEIREKLHIELRDPRNPGEDRYRLMQAVTSFLTNAASEKPILVVLEDLHDSDMGTLEMLSYVSRNLTGTRILIIGTYRDVEVDKNHPLSAALADLRRVSSFGRILLRGLNIDEVIQMIEKITHQEIPAGLAETIHRQTEGNPLFVQEVVRYLTEEKLLETSGGPMKTSDISKLEMNIPEGLRDVIGKRLTNLSEECSKVLSIAAVIGREFRFDVLEKVAGITEDEVYKALEEAKGAAIVEERSAVGAVITYRFAHAFFRQTLYEEIIAPRRVRLHQQVAQVLEVIYANRLTEHAFELAEHFSYSPDLIDLGKAVEYGEMAARHATDVYDHGETARLLERTLEVQEVFAPEDKSKRCDLLIDLSRALVGILEIQHAIDIEFPKALELADEIGDRKRATMICVWAAHAAFNKGTASHGSDEVQEWAEKAVRYAEPDTIEQGWACKALSLVIGSRGNLVEALRLTRKAMELSRKFGDHDLLTRASIDMANYGVMPWSDVRENLQLAETLFTARNNSTALWFSLNMFLCCGLREEAEEVVQAIRQLAATTGFVNHVEIAHQAEYMSAFMDGQLEAALGMMRRDIAWRKRVGLRVDFGTGIGYVCRTLQYLYGFQNIPDINLRRTVVEAWENAPQFDGIAPLLHAYQGQVDETNQRLNRMISERPDITSTKDTTGAVRDIYNLECAVLVKHQQATELLLRRLCDTSVVMPYANCSFRHLGNAAVLLGKYDEAYEHYKESFRACTKMNFRPELALTRLDFAELLLDHFAEEKAEALEHLDIAINEFSEMKMHPSLERALSRKDILKA